MARAKSDTPSLFSLPVNMSAKRILDAVRTLTSAEEMRDRIKAYEDTVRALIERVETLSNQNKRQEDRLKRLFKKMRCPKCTTYLESKQPGDTIVVHECEEVFLARCWGTEP